MFCVGNDKKETLYFEENVDKLNFRAGKYGFNNCGVLLVVRWLQELPRAGTNPESDSWHHSHPHISAPHHDQEAVRY